MTRVNHRIPAQPESTQSRLLLADAVINLMLGALLAAYPQQLVQTLGLPQVKSAFYANVLGGVLIGIAIALFIASRGGHQGLGLDGAIAINICGAGVVTIWLLVAPHDFSSTGRIVLWVVALLVLGIGVIELFHRLQHRPG